MKPTKELLQCHTDVIESYDKIYNTLVTIGLITGIEVVEQQCVLNLFTESMKRLIRKTQDAPNRAPDIGVN